MDQPFSFVSLEYILTEDYGYTQMNVYVGDYIYFQKNNLPPIQVNSLKLDYSDMELSSYAIQVDECVDKFINRFGWVMKTLKRLNEISEKERN